MPIKSRAVMHMLRENGVQNDVFQPHIEALMKLLEMQSGAKIEMSTVIIRKSFGRLLVENKSCTKHECEINSVSDSEKNRQTFNRMLNCARRPAALPCPSTEMDSNFIRKGKSFRRGRRSGIFTRTGV